MKKSRFTDSRILAILKQAENGVRSDQVGMQVSDQVNRLLEALRNNEKSATELMQTLGLRHLPPLFERTTFCQHWMLASWNDPA